MPSRTPRFADNGERHASFGGESEKRRRDIGSLELHDLGAERLRELNVVDEVSLEGAVDPVGPLVWRLHVDAEPIRVEAARDPARLAKQHAREWRVARETGHDAIDGAACRCRTAVVLSAYDLLARPIDGA